MYQSGFDITWNLKKEKGDYSFFYIGDEEEALLPTFIDGMSGTGTLTAVDCSELPDPDPSW